MIIEVNQTRSNLKEEYGIFIDNEVRYTGTGFGTSAVISCQLLRNDGTLVYKTSLQPLEEIKNMIPYKWAWGEQLTEIFTVKDLNDTIVGAFNHARSGFFDTYYNMKFKDASFKLYDIYDGKILHILIFKDDMQIGQIEKSLTVIDNLDRYTIYLLDEYRELMEILSLFAIYFDHWNYGHQGEVVKDSYRVEYKKEIKPSNKLYDMNWLKANFNVDQSADEYAEKRKKEINKKVLRWFLIIWGAAIILALGIIITVLRLT